MTTKKATTTKREEKLEEKEETTQPEIKLCPTCGNPVKGELCEVDGTEIKK